MFIKVAVNNTATFDYLAIIKSWTIMSTLFISDLHLAPERIDITNCFLRFMQTEAINADALYVLGDLFEFWIGDDDNSDFADLIRQQFRQLVTNGVRCYFVHGNRDFLIGKLFCQQTGVILLQQGTLIDLYGRKAAVFHGDTLCTQDTKYLAYRKKVHIPWLQWLFNRIPFWIKKKITAKVRLNIQDEKQKKDFNIMDVTESEIERIFDSNHIDLIIHGHTHRPKIHYYPIQREREPINITVEKSKTRIVLGDWYQQGSVLICNKDDMRLEVRFFDT